MGKTSSLLQKIEDAAYLNHGHMQISVELTEEEFDILVDALGEDAASRWEG